VHTVTGLWDTVMGPAPNPGQSRTLAAPPLHQENRNQASLTFAQPTAEGMDAHRLADGVALPECLKTYQTRCW